MSFGIANNVRSEVRECTPELLKAALDSPYVAKTCAKIEDALEKHRRGELAKEEFDTLKQMLKKHLPIVTFHAMFRNGKRKNDEAIPSGLSIYDIDHIPNPRGKWTEIEPRKEELGILFAHVSPSLEGLRLVFIIPQGMDLEKAQAWMSKQLGDVEYDACVKDYARCSFLVPRDYVLFMDEEKLFSEELSPIVIQSETQCSEESLNDKNEEVGNAEFPTAFKGTPYARIIDEWFKRTGGEPDPGERNTKLHRLASHLRYITDNNEEHLLQILPNYGLKEEEMKSLIHHACSAKFYGMPRSLQKLLSEIEKETQMNTELATKESEYDAPPPMPVRLPPLIRLLVSKTPKIYRPAVAHAVFPALGAHLWRTTFRYVDNIEHEATLMNVLMAGTGAGKNCISEPINRIMADIRKSDKENIQREKEWKDEMQTKGANKDKRKRPEGLVIQEMDPDTTNAAFVRRMADAEGRFLYTKMNEIDQFDALKTNGNKKAHFQIMCLAFDPGNVYGQTRVGTGSVCERVCIRFNWNASTTIYKGQTYFRSVLTDGPISRINFCTIPEQPIGSDMPVYGFYDASFDEELKPYIERLSRARGLVECRQARNLAKKLMQENAEFARLSQSRVYENLSFRANVIAFLKAMVLFVAQGGVWDKVTEDFIRWSLKYDMWCKMRFFGEAIEAVECGYANNLKHPGPKNLLDLLPDVFTYGEAGKMRQQQGILTGSLSLMLSNWKSRSYIEEVNSSPAPSKEMRQYRKTIKYLSTHGS